MERITTETRNEIEKPIGQYSIALSLQLLPIENMAEKMHISKDDVCVLLKLTKVEGKSIYELRQEKRKEVERRLKKNEDLDKIAFDLNVSRDAVEDLSIVYLDKRERQIRKMQRLLQAGKKSKVSNITRRAKPLKSMSAREKTMLMREKYEQILSKAKSEQEENNISEQEKRLNDILISAIEEKIMIANGSYSKKKQYALEMINDVTELLNKRLTIKQSRQIEDLVTSDSFRNFTGKDTPMALKLRGMISKAKLGVVNTVWNEAQKTTDIDELNRLYKMVSGPAYNHFETDVIRRKIESKINNITMQKKQKTAVSKNMKNIAAQIANGSAEVNDIEEAINTEIAEKKKQIPQGKFGLTDEQIRAQILIQLRSVLMKQATKYSVKNVESTLSTLNSLAPNEYIENFRAVVMNLANRGSFKSAKRLCLENAQSMSNLAMRTIAGEVKKAELGHVINNSMNRNLTDKEEIKLWKSIENVLQNENAKKEDIIVLQSNDGSTKITLSDIWPESNEKTRN